MKNISIWKDTIKKKEYPSLLENSECDVLIIGGGITGASTFYQLKKTNLKVMLVEQGEIAMSTTGSSTGKLSFMQNDLIDKIRSNLGDETASLYLKSQCDAINLAVDIIKRENIACDLEKVDSKIYTNKKSEVEKLKDLERFLKDNGFDVQKTQNELVKSKYAIACSNTYMFHPVKFVYGLLENSQNIYEHTSIKKIVSKGDYYLCYTDKVKIKAKWVVIASHYPYFNLPFFFPIKGSLEKSYISASKVDIKDLSMISYSNPFISIRTYLDYLIYLSNSHSINADTNDKKNFQELLKKVHDLKLEPEYLWSNIDIMTNDGLPYIGKLKKNLLIATGYNTWGLATSVLAGLILKDIITNQKNNYIELFSPSRVNVNQITGGISDIFKNIGGFISGMKKQNKVKSNNNTLSYKGHTVSKKCPHMGCSLLLNEVEETWDCPCHGSRFTLDGKCISAPSNCNINKK